MNILIRKQTRLKSKKRWEKYQRLRSEGKQFAIPQDYLKLKRYEYRYNVPRKTNHLIKHSYFK